MDLMDIILAKKLGGGKLPFGETKEVVEILPEATVTEENIEAWLFSLPRLGLMTGETYTVNWNGVAYVREARADTDGGNTFVILGATDNEPFAIVEYPPEVAAESGMNVTIEPTDGVIPFTVSIRQEQTTITPLPAKYLPKGMGYIEEGDMVEILPETTLTCSEEEHGEFLLTENPPVLKVGERYIVTWNGVEYGGTAVDASEMMGAGSVVVANDGADIQTSEGCVFAIAYMLDVGNGQPALYIIDFAAGATTVTLSIKGKGETIHKLDNRCLPDGTANVFDVNITVESGEVTSIDKTFAEIYAAATQGNTIVRGLLNEGSGFAVLPLALCYAENFALFSAAYYMDARFMVSIRVGADDTATYSRGS